MIEKYLKLIKRSDEIDDVFYRNKRHKSFLTKKSVVDDLGVLFLMSLLMIPISCFLLINMDSIYSFFGADLSMMNIGYSLSFNEFFDVYNSFYSSTVDGVEKTNEVYLFMYITPFVIYNFVFLLLLLLKLNISFSIENNKIIKLFSFDKIDVELIFIFIMLFFMIVVLSLFFITKIYSIGLMMIFAGTLLAVWNCVSERKMFENVLKTGSSLSDVELKALIEKKEKMTEEIGITKEIILESEEEMEKVAIKAYNSESAIEKNIANSLLKDFESKHKKQKKIEVAKSNIKMIFSKNKNNNTLINE